ncbi:MAG: hypothetical protein CML42_06550 [Rhodobacteraceae bacterium]|nr:hypothetical protein [Paracoccaceae bacterium]|tara:strand:- start:28575 stop:29180 length:606 start_codon:yes stop_codon:yes gene_type:complete
MKCFENPSPNINGNEYILNKKSKTIYNHIKKKANRFYLKSGQNSTGTIKYDKVGKITKVRNYNTLQQLARGSALCDDCSGSGISSDISGNLNNYNANYTIVDITEVEPPRMTMYWTGAEFRADRLNNFADINPTTNGGTIFIDPEKKFFGDKNACNEDLFLNYVKMNGKVPLTKNKTKETYLANYKVPGSRTDRTSSIYLK